MNCPKCGWILTESKYESTGYIEITYRFTNLECSGYITKKRTNKPYKKNEGGCFITSTVLNYLGKDDDCYELNLFRQFIDSWLKKEYSNLITEYFNIAPNIVSILDSLVDKDLVYKTIWSKYLERVMSLFSLGSLKKQKVFMLN